MINLFVWRVGIGKESSFVLQVEGHRVGFDGYSVVSVERGGLYRVTDRCAVGLFKAQFDLWAIGKLEIFE